MKKTFAMSLVLFAASAFAAEAPDLTGNWTLHMSVAGNESDQPCKFVQTGNKLAGACKGPEKDVQIVGNIDGKKLTFKYESEYQGTPLTVMFTATLDGSDKIAGAVDVDPFGVTGDFTATPSKPEKK